uniref:RING-type domain-containing protein n=1 Tax=viral metagenome TaxID=1070528 RepID=A0A6C0KU65_9ZZZZ
MSVCGRYFDGEHDRPIFKTTFLVPAPDSSTHHIHFSLGERLEGEVRDIVIEGHPVASCSNPARFSNGTMLYLDEIKRLVSMGFPIDQVCDWTAEEAQLVSSGMCPETPEIHQERQAFEAEIQQLLAEEAIRQANLRQPTQPSWGDWAEEAEQEAMQEYMRDQLQLSASAPQEEEDFPLEFEDEEKCPACMEDEYTEETYLLRLPCGHTLCKGCLKGVENKCPKCRKGIDRSLIKRKQKK